MAVLTDFALYRLEDAVLSVSLTPQTAIGQQNIRFKVSNRFGGVSGVILKSVASGYNNSSGINITNSGAGNFNIAINSVDTSGLEFGNYAYAVERLDSGSRTIISEGYLLLLPGGTI